MKARILTRTPAAGGRRRRHGIVLLIAALLCGTVCAGASASGATWRFAPAQAPPPPSGSPAAPYPVPLGEVGDIRFWSPDRGLLITAGTEAQGGVVPPGLYAYNGREWHQLATVCGGGSGRIAWAGPDDFWTISDQREGQLVSGLNPSAGLLRSLSLCHFREGEVVASYAMPLQQPDSYLKMDAAACFSPEDCWFGGQDGVGVNHGAFHLHWDGSSLNAVYEPEDHAIDNMIVFEGAIYESVRIQGSDTYLPEPEENPAHPALLHTIAPAGSTPTFSDFPAFAHGHPLPNYGEGVLPAALQGFSLGTDGGPLGVGATQLWAAAAPLPPSQSPPNSKPASLTVLRYAQGGWTQIAPEPGGGSPLPGEAKLAGSGHTQVGEGGEESGANEAIAPEPGSDSAWLSLRNLGPGATVALLSASGTLTEFDTLPSEQEPVGERGEAGPIVCPAAGDCWMATNRSGGVTTSGWLFHLTAGAPEEYDVDPNFAKVITYRPPDAGVPVIYPDAPPVDDSLANQQPPAPPSGPPLQTPAPPPKPARAVQLVRHIHTKLVGGRTLVLSFTLRARARVQLIARRRGVVVAKSRAESLRPGPHQLSLLLDPRRWPTRFQFKATPLGVRAPPATGSEGTSGNTIGT